MAHIDSVSAELEVEDTPSARDVPAETWTSAILQTLAAADGPLTLRDIEKAVGRLVQVAGPAPVREEIELLRRYEFLELAETSRAVKLTPEGRALADAFAYDQD